MLTVHYQLPLPFSMGAVDGAYIMIISPWRRSFA